MSSPTLRERIIEELRLHEADLDYARVISGRRTVPDEHYARRADRILRELEAESATTPLGWQACPVCGGRGTVPCDFYGRIESSSAAPFPITCRTCDGRTVLPVGAGGRAEPPARGPSVPEGSEGPGEQSEGGASPGGSLEEMAGGSAEGAPGEIRYIRCQPRPIAAGRTIGDAASQPASATPTPAIAPSEPSHADVEKEVSEILRRVTQKDPTYWLDGSYVRWGAVERDLIAALRARTQPQEQEGSDDEGFHVYRDGMLVAGNLPVDDSPPSVGYSILRAPSAEPSPSPTTANLTLPHAPTPAERTSPHDE